MAELTTYELNDRIATITLDDGKVNALSIPMLKSIHAGLDQAAADKAVTVITGREGTLSAGFDLKTFESSPEDLMEMLKLGATLSERILAFETPVLISCPGHAIAAGSFLLMSADLRIGVDGPFKIGLNEAKIGMTVPLYVIELARQRLSPVHFNRSLGTAHMYSPQEAVEAGFLDSVVAADELAAATAEAAAELAGLDPAAHLGNKQRVRATALEAVRAAIQAELPG